MLGLLAIVLFSAYVLAHYSFFSNISKACLGHCQTSAQSFCIYHCVKGVRILSFSGPYFPIFSPNAGKYGPEKIRLRTLHRHLPTQS